MCKDTIHSQSKAERRKQIVRNSDLKRFYGIDLETYNRMFAEQKGCCAICGTHELALKTRLCVDHNHTTKKVRGLLCQSCNKMLGHALENVDTLKSAVDYLQDWS